MAKDEKNHKDLRVDEAHLYREEIFTDLKVATLRRMTPVKPDGLPDPSRPPLFSAETQVMSQVGPVPIQCPIEARTLKEAIDKFPAAIEEAIEKIVQEARDIRRREASRIVVPGAIPGGFPGTIPPSSPGRIELG